MKVDDNFLDIKKKLKKMLLLCVDIHWNENGCVSSIFFFSLSLQTMQLLNYKHTSIKRTVKWMKSGRTCLKEIRIFNVFLIIIPNSQLHAFDTIFSKYIFHSCQIKKEISKNEMNFKNSEFEYHLINSFSQVFYSILYIFESNSKKC